MFLEMIFEIVVVFDPDLSFRVHNKLHQLSPRIAYMDLGIVPLAAPAFFFLFAHCFPELITTFTLSALGVIFRFASPARHTPAASTRGQYLSFA